MEKIKTINKDRGQTYLGEKGLIALITLLSAFIPLSTDLYLPALPGMAKYFNVPVNQANLTLILFMAFFGLGMLIWGPLSDRYGRKPVLIAGLSLYIIASLSCIYAGTIYHLIIYRIFQALGGGAASAVATAMVKDVYQGRQRETALAMVQSMVVLSPAVAPVIGGIILEFTSWRGVFLLLAAIGALAMTGAVMMKETIENCHMGTIGETIGRLGSVLKNPGFTSLLIVFSLSGIPFMAFLASSSYIYIDGFRLSARTYGYYFTANAIGLLLGPILYLYLSKKIGRSSIIIVCFLLVAISGLLICTFGSLKPWIFAISLLPSTLAGSCIRPPGVNLMLEQQQEDTGSVVSLIGCTGICTGSIGMMLISLNWNNLILALGTITIIIPLICEAIWLSIFQKPFIKQIPDTAG